MGNIVSWQGCIDFPTLLLFINLFLDQTNRLWFTCFLSCSETWSTLPPSLLQKAVPDIWNAVLLAQADKIYKDTIGPVISEDGETTETFILPWKAYRLQIASLLHSVFGEENMIPEMSTSFNHASAQHLRGCILILSIYCQKILRNLVCLGLF